MTEEEFRKEMTELGWDSDYINGIIEDLISEKLAGITPPPLESFVMEFPIIND